MKLFPNQSMRVAKSFLFAGVFIVTIARAEEPVQPQVQPQVSADSPLSVPPKADAVPAPESAPKAESRIRAQGGVGYSFITYEDTRGYDVFETAFTIKSGVQYSLESFPLEFGLGGYLTLLPITSNFPQVTRFFGLNARVGYVFPQLKNPWRLVLSLGWYYTTMLTEGDRFGFQHMMGPQLYPSLSYRFKQGGSLSGYLKYSPMTRGFSLKFLSPGSRELAFGLSYLHPLMPGVSIGGTLDLSFIQMLIDQVDIGANSITLGATIGI